MWITSLFTSCPPRIPLKQKKGANGRFLPKPFLFHLRYLNSEINEPRFCEKYLNFILVPRGGFEPPCLSALPPQGSKSTNFSIWAFYGFIILINKKINIFLRCLWFYLFYNNFIIFYRRYRT